MTLYEKFQSVFKGPLGYAVITKGRRAWAVDARSADQVTQNNGRVYFETTSGKICVDRLTITFHNTNHAGGVE